MINTLTSNPIVLSLAAALVGASPYIYLSLAGRLMTLPALSKSKSLILPLTPMFALPLT